MALQTERKIAPMLWSPAAVAVGSAVAVNMPFAATVVVVIVVVVLNALLIVSLSPSRLARRHFFCSL